MTDENQPYQGHRDLSRTRYFKFLLSLKDCSSIEATKEISKDSVFMEEEEGIQLLP